MKTYVVKLAVPASRMGDILGLLEREIADVTIAIREDVARPPRLNGEAAKLLGPPAARPGLADVILGALADGPKPKADIVAAMTAHGFSVSSFNTASAKLQAAKKIKRVEVSGKRGKWALR